MDIITENLDFEIKNIDDSIYENIEISKDFDRGFLSQNILKRLRDLIEHTAVKILSIDSKKELDLNYANIEEATNYIKRIAKYRDLAKFHRFVQNSVGHYTPTKENAERLMLKYYEYLLKLKTFYKNTYGMEILKNLDKFPLNTDKSYYEYYGEIAQNIDRIAFARDRRFIDGRYYIQKSKPFFINSKIYYEVTLSPAVGNASKFDRITMFTKCNIETSYAIKVSVVKTMAKIFGTYTEIQIINNWEVAIRPCEIKNMIKIFGKRTEYGSSYAEYKKMMPYLTRNGINLLDLANMEEKHYKDLKESFKSQAQKLVIFDLLDECRYILKDNKDGSNIIRYLLYKCNNTVIKKQLGLEENVMLSNLYLRNGCIPFEEMPFVTSLVGHNPKSYDLFDCIDAKGREEELLARYIKINTEQNGCLYTSKKDVEIFGDVDLLVKRYNSKLYIAHENRELVIEGDNIYIRGYEKNTIKILEQLKELTKEGIEGHKNSVENWLDTENYVIDDVDKRNILENLFENSKVALIYGAAGTGKTTLINHISNYYGEERKIFLANTHPAVENLKRKVDASNGQFYTIKKILNNGYIRKKCDILIIDECSTVSNQDMLNILNEIDFKLLVLVGDIYQIESITFGNWFSIANILIDNKAKYELDKPYRSKNKNLKILWDKVRALDDDITEFIAKNRYAQRLDLSILKPEDYDEIILCLNYDGLYGINNINRFMQNSNPNEAVDWGIGRYKVEDPILFIDNNRFSPVLYNNLKGRIVNIQVNEAEHRIWFDIETDIIITEEEAESVGLELIASTETRSTIRFYVDEFKDVDDDDDESSDTIVPFVVAYAVSIHKSQGLEYNSVKIIITSEIEEMISHNIFYTAITRAMQKLKIYWTPECMDRILKNMKPKFNAKDASIIRNKMNKLKIDV